MCVGGTLGVCHTYSPLAVGAAEAHGLVGLPPGLEQVFKDSRLGSLTHHLHVGGGWVAFGFDKALGGEEGHDSIVSRFFGRRWFKIVMQNNVEYYYLIVMGKTTNVSLFFIYHGHIFIP